METAHKIGIEFDSCNSYPVFETAAYLMVSVTRLGDFLNFQGTNTDNS